MRARNVLVLLSAILGTGGLARADKVTADLAAGYEKEAAACATQAGGVAKVAEGAARLAPTLAGPEREALDADLAKLTRGRGVVDGYCAELAAVLAVLHDHPDAKYKALERELDEHDNRVRRARADAKRVIAELEPVIHALVPRINARPAPEPERRPPTKFPSGHAVALPPLAGTWRVSGTPTSDTAEYAEAKLAATVWTKAFEGATCEQEKRAATGATEAALPDAGKALGLAWLARGPTRVVACLPGPSASGGWMGYATTEGTEPPAALREALEALLLRMLAAQKG